MKETVLTIIFEKFAEWLESENFCCRAGCSTCCTTEVTLTANEASMILGYCRSNPEAGDALLSLAETYAEQNIRPVSLSTTNEFVAASLKGGEVAAPLQNRREKCVFLREDICTIYPVRPFGCRCFVSTTPCSKDSVATVPDDCLYGSTAVMQVIEHLGQGENWGYLSDVLLLEAAREEVHGIAQILGAESVQRLALQVRKARPLPGFIIDESVAKSVNALLESIFSASLGSLTFEQYLNGRRPTRCAAGNVQQ